MTYLFLGQDPTAKDTKIAEFKKKFLTSAQALKFDYEVLHAHKLEPETLKKALMALPVLSKHRLIIVRECHKLSPPNKDLILEFVKSPGSCVLILDSDKVEADDAFTKKLGRLVKV